MSKSMMAEIRELQARIKELESCMTTPRIEDLDKIAYLQLKITSALEYLNREGTPYIYSAIAALEEALEPTDEEPRPHHNDIWNPLL